MNTSNPLRPSPLRVAMCLALSAGIGTTVAAPLVVSEIPLFVASGNKPNVLLTIANSNSMDENADGVAVGSDNFFSRSEMARRVAKNLIVNYGGGLNMGLMAFQQNSPALYSLYGSPYDITFDPTKYDPTYTGPRAGATKRLRQLNTSWPGPPDHYFYYNVNLPMYDTNPNLNGFCWSNKADASADFVDFNGGDGYRCFRNKTSTASTRPTVPTEAALGWSVNFWNPGLGPTDSDYAQGITDFGMFLAFRYVGPTWFNNGSPGNGYLHVPIAAVDVTQAANMNAKLGTSQFGANHYRDAGWPLQNAGLTPIEGTLYTIRDYFAGNLTDVARGGPKPAPPNSCGKNFSVVLTNGLPSATRFGVASTDKVAMLAAATTAAASVYGAGPPTGVLNYIVGFSLPYGVNPAQLNTIAAAGGTITSYYAENEATLTAKLNEVFNDILVRSGAAGAVALNSGSIQSNSRLFQAKFNTGDWSGQLQAFPIDSTTGAIGGFLWDAGAEINAQHWSTGRTIITYNPVSDQGVPFRWPAVPASPTASELSPAQVLALNTSPLAVVDGNGSSRLQYLRGDASNEGSGGTNFRKRNVSKLGDIVNSSPAFVQKPGQNLIDPSYIAFKAANAGRLNMIYVGSNDGMLHGLRADTGEEVLGFVPSVVFPRLSGLTAQGFAHKYMVDGSPVVRDIQLGVGWRTVLVSGLSGGGRGLFALDVTDPSSFSEADADDIVLWEFTSSDDADLGLTYSQAAIIKLNDGQPGVVVGNGYNNTGTGRAILFVLNAETGAVIRKIDTGVGSVGTPNGLSTPAVIDLDGNGTADYAYAGDLRGNIWKFDLTAGAAGSWSISYGAPLYTALDGGGVAQPITSAVEMTRHPSGGLMVLFGTGQYIQTTDVANTASQSLYGVRDNGAVVAGRANLVSQTITEVVTSGGEQYRAVSNNAVDYTTKSGWYLDLPTAGERVVVDPVLRNGRFIVPTTIPSADPCAVGGYSWLMEVDYLGGGRLNKAVFDVNQDGVVNASDIVAFSPVQHAAGVRMDAIASSPAIVGGFEPPDGTPGEPMAVKYLNQSNGDIAPVRESEELLRNRRASWRQVL